VNTRLLLEWLDEYASGMLRDNEPHALCDHVWQTRNIILRLEEWKGQKA
jgi:hypothetical protein